MFGASCTRTHCSVSDRASTLTLYFPNYVHTHTNVSLWLLCFRCATNFAARENSEFGARRGGQDSCRLRRRKVVSGVCFAVV